MPKKILVRFTGEAKGIIGVESLEVKVKEDNLTILDFLKDILKEKIEHFLEKLNKGRYIVLLDGINIVYLKGLSTPLRNVSTVSIVHAALGG